MGKIALFQLISGNNKENNLAVVSHAIKRSVAAGAELVVLPENFALFSNQKATQQAERNGEGPIQRHLMALARQHGIWIVAGSVPLCQRPDGTSPEGGRIRAACLVYDNSGQQVARYDKLHLFDVDVADSQGVYRESATYEPGDTPVVIDSPVGKLGLSICYDLRFPELYRRLVSEGAEVLLVPSAFTAVTGEAHWKILLQARAIENQCYVVAANQGGMHANGRETWGRSMAIGPWGDIIVKCGQGEHLLMASINLPELKQVRLNMPSFQHRVLD